VVVYHTAEDYLAPADDALKEIARLDVRQTLLPQYRLIKADLLMARGDQARALQILRGLAKGDLSERFRAESLHKEVLCLTALGRVEDAKVVYKKLKDEHPYADATLRVKDDLKSAMLRDRRPEISPVDGIYVGKQRIEINTRKSGLRVYYSIDGSIPTRETGTRYTLPFELEPSEEDIVLTAVAYERGRQVSPPVHRRYTIKADRLADVDRRPDIAWTDLPYTVSCAIYEERLGQKVQVPLNSRGRVFIPDGNKFLRQDFALAAPPRNIDRRGHAHWGTREPFTVIAEAEIPKGAKRFGAHLAFIADYYSGARNIFDIVAVEASKGLDKNGKEMIKEHKLLEQHDQRTHFSEYVNFPLPKEAIKVQIRFCDRSSRAQNLALKDVGFFR